MRPGPRSAPRSAPRPEPRPEPRTGRRADPSPGPRPRRPARALTIVFVEPYDGGSHTAFARGWAAHSRHRFRFVSLPGTRWKWRMRVGGLVLGERLGRLFAKTGRAGEAGVPDAVVATSLLDLSHLQLRADLGARRGTEGVPFLLYLHENELTYPRPPGEALERGFAVAHLASLYAADGVAINSRAHREALRAEIDRFFDEIPAPKPRRPRGAIHVLPPGVDFDGFPAPSNRPSAAPPVIAWNHRWEDDKRPAAFARTVLRLCERDRAFRLVLLGPNEQAKPRPLELIRGAAADRILRDGPANDRREYVHWLCRGDIAVSTAAQENFGYAAVEAMAAGAVPLLPRRLSYPEIVPRALHAELLYDTDRELLARLTQWLLEPARVDALRARTMRAGRAHAWPSRADALDAWVEDAVAAQRARRRN